jgi:hypothetical protein
MNTLAMNHRDVLKGIRNARFVASFALLGAVLVGVVTGGHDFGAADPRLFGAGAGAIVALAVKLLHLI